MNKNNIIEIYGDNFTGKTLYALSLIKDNDLSLYIDADCKLRDNLNYNENMIIMKNNDIKTIYDVIKQMVNELDIIIIDSLPSIISDKDINNLQYDFHIFKEIREIISLCKNNNCDLIIVNQLRLHKNNIKKSFGLRALGLYYTRRVYIDDNGNPTITKNIY